MVNAVTFELFAAQTFISNFWKCQLLNFLKVGDTHDSPKSPVPPSLIWCKLKFDQLEYVTVLH